MLSQLWAKTGQHPVVEVGLSGKEGLNGGDQGWLLSWARLSQVELQCKTASFSWAAPLASSLLGTLEK